MNAKLRSILHTAWNEPRHFFFWLAMMSVCGFIAAAGGAALTSPTVVLAFIALGCALCFVVSIPAFVLAWIPPVRRLFSWLLRWRFLVLGCLATLVALFYAIEDWRGRHAWQSYKRAWEAKGERFDLASFVPPPVPNDQNFFETPLWTDLHSAETNRSFVSDDPDRPQRVIFSVYGPNGEKAPGTGNWVKAQHVDLAAWQAFYRGGSTNVSEGNAAAQAAFRKRYGLGGRGIPPAAPENAPPTNYFPVAKEPQTPAADVLLALSKFDENRKLLIAAAARPEARFWINYDAGFAMSLQHLARMKSCVQYLSFHANAALKAGQRETALEDVSLSFRLIEAIRGEPNLLSHLVRIAMQQITLQPIWEGLADRQWTEADLSVIESKLGKMDFLADYHFAIRGERSCNVWGVDYYRKGGVFAVVESDAPSKAAWPLDVEQFLGTAAFRLIPSGWFDQNKLSLCRMHEKYLLPLVSDREPRVVPPAGVRQASSALEKLSMRAYDVFSKMMLPAMTRFADKCARTQCCADLARVACALERYRLANGQFPEALEALAPKFIEKLPRDVINGQPLKFRRTDDGQFILYSVGWNEIDDGGTVGLTKYGNPDWSKGDWVWRYPVK
jgi:hypothetical protein